MISLILPLAMLAAPLPPSDAEARGDALIEGLRSEEYAVRCAAHRDLRAMSLWIEPLLRKNRTHPDPEVAWRCRDILATLCVRVVRRKPVKGKIALSDDKTNRIAIDVRERDGVLTGDRFTVTRLGGLVGVITVVEVCKWGCWAEPEKPATVDSFQKADVVDRFDER